MNHPSKILSIIPRPPAFFGFLVLSSTVENTYRTRSPGFLPFLPLCILILLFIPDPVRSRKTHPCTATTTAGGQSPHTYMNDALTVWPESACAKDIVLSETIIFDSFRDALHSHLKVRLLAKSQSPLDVFPMPKHRSLWGYLKESYLVLPHCNSILPTEARSNRTCLKETTQTRLPDRNRKPIGVSHRRFLAAVGCVGIASDKTHCKAGTLRLCREGNNLLKLSDHKGL